MKKQIIALTVILVITLVMTSCGSKSSTPQTSTPKTDQTAIDTSGGSSKEVAQVYQCPMKCEGEITYNQPDKCPKCGMDLKEMENHEGHQH